MNAGYPGSRYHEYESAASLENKERAESRKLYPSMETIKGIERQIVIAKTATM